MKKEQNTFIVSWKPVEGGTESSFLTDSEDEAIQNFKDNVRLGHRVCIKVLR